MIWALCTQRPSSNAHLITIKLKGCIRSLTYEHSLQCCCDRSERWSQVLFCLRHAIWTICGKTTWFKNSFFSRVACKTVSKSITAPNVIALSGESIIFIKWIIIIVFYVHWAGQVNFLNQVRLINPRVNTNVRFQVQRDHWLILKPLSNVLGH